MRGRLRRASLCGAGAFLLLGPPAAFAQAFETVGTRALGMGGAFVAVADDATAPYWNPAGLVTGSLFSLIVERQRPEPPTADDPADRERASTLVSLTTPSLGLSYYRVRASSVEREVTEDQATGAREGGGSERVRLGSLVTRHTAITVVRSLVAGLVVGTAFKIVTGEAAFQSVEAQSASAAELLDQASELTGNASREFDLDVGVMATFGQIQIGVVARNLRTPEFRTDAGDRVRLDRQVRAGLAFKPVESLTIAVDADLTETPTSIGPRRNVALGAEQWLGSRLGLRGGIRASTVDRARPVAAIGLSVALGSTWWLDGQVTRGDRPEDRSWGFAWPYVGSMYRAAYSTSYQAASPCQNDVLKLVPAETAQKYQIIPLSRAGASLTIAMTDPTNVFAMDDIKFMTGYNVEPVVASEVAILEAFNRYYATPVTEPETSSVSALDVASRALEELPEIDGDAVEVIQDLEEIDVSALERQGGEAPVVRLVNLVLMSTIHKGGLM